MDSTSTENFEAPPDPSGKHSGSQSVSIADRVQWMGDESKDSSEFLKILADELHKTLDAAVVVLESRGWPDPIMLVSDQELARAIAPESIRTLLATAALVPVSCEVPTRGRQSQPSIEGNDSMAHVDASLSSMSVRGLRVEITGEPRRSAIVLIYPSHNSPSAAKQLHDLKLLSLYVDASRKVMHRLPADSSLGIRGISRTDSEISSKVLSHGMGFHDSLRSFHRDLDVDATAYRIANESRRLVGCDRVTVLIRRGDDFRTHAISGVPVVDRRSNHVRSIENLAARASVLGRPLILPTEEPLPAQILEPLDQYLDQSAVSSVVMLPLMIPDGRSAAADELGDWVGDNSTDIFAVDGEMIAVLAMEYFSGPVADQIEQPMSLIAGEASFAMRNALEHQRVFGLRLWKTIGSAVQSSHFSKAAAAFVIAVGLLIAGALVRVEHYVAVSGNAQPAIQRQVFAPLDGVVKKIHVTDGQKISAGDLIFELENSELENRAESLANEIKTATQRLASIQAVRLSAHDDRTQPGRLAVEEGQLRSDLANLQAQQQLIRKQQDELLVRSPIGGTVSGWQLNRRLGDRPVSRGNLLINIVDHDGPWSLRLEVPDRDAGPILQAFGERAELPIRFAVATQPESSFAATLKTIATASRKNEFGDHVIDATAEVVLPTTAAEETTVDAAGPSDPISADELDLFQPHQVRAGADVRARIACGQRSLLGSWFGDIVDFVNRNVLFHFR